MHLDDLVTNRPEPMGPATPSSPAFVWEHHLSPTHRCPGHCLPQRLDLESRAKRNTVSIPHLPKACFPYPWVPPKCPSLLVTDPGNACPLSSACGFALGLNSTTQFFDEIPSMGSVLKGNRFAKKSSTLFSHYVSGVWM